MECCLWIESDLDNFWSMRVQVIGMEMYTWPLKSRYERIH